MVAGAGTAGEWANMEVVHTVMHRIVGEWGTVARGGG